MTMLEQRMSPRHKAPAKTIVYTTESFGQILDISTGGFSLKYIDMETPVREQEIVDIFLGSLTLRKIPVTVVWQTRSPLPSNDAIIMSTLGVKFDNLTDRQRSTIDYFIEQQAVGRA